MHILHELLICFKLITGWFSVDPTVLGLALTMLVQLSGVFQWCVRQSAEVVNQMVNFIHVAGVCVEICRRTYSPGLVGYFLRKGICRTCARVWKVTSGGSVRIPFRFQAYSRAVATRRGNCFSGCICQIQAHPAISTQQSMLPYSSRGSCWCCGVSLIK